MQQDIQRVAGVMLDKRGGRVAGKNDVLITIESGGQDRACMGTFAANSWANVDLESREIQLKREAYKIVSKETGEESTKYKQVGTIHEISLKAEHLTGTVYQILGTLAHELVHLENHDHGVRDCSKGGAHNNEFKKTAEEWGLEFNDTRHPTKGWAFTKEGEVFKAFVDEECKPIVEVYNVARVTQPKVSSQSNMISLRCQCAGTKEEPATLSMSRGAAQTRLETDSLPQCPACEGTFMPQA
jgi:hypothetical protein